MGWGSEVDEKEGKEVEYWIARNSWGDRWGPNSDGYVKILRGANYGGIESQAVSILPDPCRGAFKEHLDRHLVETGTSWSDLPKSMRTCYQSS